MDKPLNDLFCTFHPAALSPQHKGRNEDSVFDLLRVLETAVDVDAAATAIGRRDLQVLAFATDQILKCSPEDVGFR